ncbi:hypothetical protein Q9X96_003026 [Vibrio vulnificus]|nr:hypothetical protein [Vibrio vulnificus]ELV8801240.1 hypothetical protein [Vibrio vulnificus]
MKLKPLFSVGILFAITLSGYTQASNEWNPTQVYNSGDLVTWKGKAYLSSHWTQGVEPLENDINWDGWIFVDENNLKTWTPQNAFLGGDLVKIDSQYYMANWWNQNEYPETSSSWRHLKNVEFNGDTSPDKPVDNDSVEGLDTDNNGVRDDYEVTIRNLYSSEELLNVALSASQEWKKLIKLGLDESIPVTKEEASQIFVNLISASRCFTEIRKADPNFKSPTQFYFNTFERAMKKREAEDRLYRTLQGDLSLINPPQSPCNNLTLVTQNEN